MFSGVKPRYIQLKIENFPSLKQKKPKNPSKSNLRNPQPTTSFMRFLLPLNR